MGINRLVSKKTKIVDIMGCVKTRHSGKKKNKKLTLRSKNPYLSLLIKLYRFLHRRRPSNFNKTVLNRLLMSRVNRPPISTSKIRKLMSDKSSIAVVVGTVTDDVRNGHEMLRGIKVCALRYTRTARDRIIKAGGQCLSFDQLALASPCGSNCVLLRGSKTSRGVFKRFRTAVTKTRKGVVKRAT